MTKSLGFIVELITIISFSCGVLNYTIVKPLQVSIDTLTLSVNKLENMLHKVEADELNLRERVIAGEVHIEDLRQTVGELKTYHKGSVGGNK